MTDEGENQPDRPRQVTIEQPLVYETDTSESDSSIIGLESIGVLRPSKSEELRLNDI